MTIHRSPRPWPMLLAPVLLAAGPQMGPEKLSIPGVENPYRVSERVYSGGQPEGEEAFRALASLGVRTILTVDGAAPDVEMARKYGIRYVHVPVGYNGIDDEQARQIVRAGSLPGPVFIHCHHGLHRGPTAVSLCMIALEGWSADRATEWMGVAGTAEGYSGLYDTVRRFRPPAPAELARDRSPLPERAPVPGFVEQMIGVDDTFDHLKAIAKAGFRTPADQPDLEPAHEALMLAEHYREAARLPEAKEKGEDLVAALDAADGRATALEAALRRLAADPKSEEAGKETREAYDRVSKDCKACHAANRDLVKP